MMVKRAMAVERVEAGVGVMVEETEAVAIVAGRADGVIAMA